MSLAASGILLRKNPQGRVVTVLRAFGAVKGMCRATLVVAQWSPKISFAAGLGRPQGAPTADFYSEHT